MQIPKKDEDRLPFYQEVIRQCFLSAPQRKTQYTLLKYYFLNGCPPEEGAAAFNKIYPTVDTLTSFLFSADSTRFSCELGPDADRGETAKLRSASKAVNTEWRFSNGDMIFGQALMWALVYNTVIVKTIVRDGRVFPFFVDPDCFGVYREDVNYLDRQEAVAHRYLISRSQLTADIKSHPNRSEILADLAPRPQSRNDDMPEGLRRIIVGNQFGSAPISPGSNIVGSSDFLLDARVEYIPASIPDMIDMVELWIWDDDLADYQTVTIADGRCVIFDRENIFLPRREEEQGEHPFIQVCPSPLAGYFWGMSDVARFIGLQQFRNERMSDIRRLLKKQVDPPTTLYGMFGAVDELSFAYNNPGSVMSTSDPMAKRVAEKVEVHADLWRDILQIDEMLAEASGLQNLLMGKGESGVRSGRQTSELARLGSSRIKKRALIIEDSLDALATMYLKIMRRHDTSHYMTDPGNQGEKPVPFILAQLEHGCLVRVDAHSNSPLFAEDHKQEAFALLEARAITRSALIDILNPPNKDVLQTDLLKIEAAEKQAGEQKMKMEMAKNGPKQA